MQKKIFIKYVILTFMPIHLPNYGIEADSERFEWAKYQQFDKNMLSNPNLTST